MEKIESEKLLQVITELIEDQRIFIDFPIEISNKLELLQLKINSSELLFTAYINNTSELANEFNLEKFLTFYANLTNEKDFLFKDTALSIIGTEIYNYCLEQSNRIIFFLDNDLKKLIFRKLPKINEVSNISI
jgi:hypothetical protein